MTSTTTRRALVYEKLRRGDGIILEMLDRGIEAVLPFGPDSCLRRHDPISEETIVELAAGFQAIVGASGARITRSVMEALPDLRIISKLGIGYDVIDIDAATSLGIQVTNTPSLVEIDCVAEHAIALMLAGAKRLNYYDTKRMAQGGWLSEDTASVALRGKTVGLVGFGRIGRAVATRLQGWGLQILACDLPDRQSPSPGVRFVEMSELLAESDFVSLHVSTSLGAAPVIGRSELASMKPSAVLVNTARGANIDQQALFEALKDGQLLAAALDVYVQEPPPLGEPLFTLENVIATPHLGASAPEAEADMEAMAADNIQQVFDGQIPATLLNPDSLRHARK